MKYGLDLKLYSGRVIHLCQLFQSPTYAGLLEGQPSASLNKEIIEKAMRDVGERLWNAGTPHLIEPVIQVRAGYSTPSLPPAVCLASFECFQGVSDPDEGYMSSLSLVWFQDDFALPIDPLILDKIKAVDWERLAEDWEC